MKPLQPTDPQASAAGVSRRAEVRLGPEELAQAVGISLATLERLIRIGLVEPTDPAGREFTAGAARRLARMLRLHQDLEVSLMGAAVIVDLLERLEDLERDLSRRRS